MRDIMKRGLTATTVLTALAALGLGLGLTAPAGAVATSSAATAASHASGPRYVVLNCAMKAQTMPGSYVLACADDGAGLQGLHWTTWTARLASGYGTEYENDCIPNCASGHFHHY